MQLILKNERGAVALLEQGERERVSALAAELYPAGTALEWELYGTHAALLFVRPRREGFGLLFASFDDLDDCRRALGLQGEVYEWQGSLCLLSAPHPAGREFGRVLTPTACARVREAGKRLCAI